MQIHNDIFNNAKTSYIEEQLEEDVQVTRMERQQVLQDGERENSLCDCLK